VGDGDLRLLTPTSRPCRRLRNRPRPHLVNRRPQPTDAAGV